MGVETIISGVLAMLIGTALVAIIGWLRDPLTRERLQTCRRQATCDHRWEPINKPGDRLIIVTPDDERCVKCNKRR